MTSLPASVRSKAMPTDRHWSAAGRRTAASLRSSIGTSTVALSALALLPAAD